MELSPNLPHVAHFDAFEVDLRSGELRQPGSRIRLQDQPLQILTLLLEHAGQVVGREELENRLWPDGVVVDFEHSINSAVKRLRKALDDDAEHPHYIETIPRHGYRFIATVDFEPAAQDPREGTAAAERPNRRRVAVLAGGGVLAILAVLVVFNVAGLRNGLLGRATSQPKIRSLAVLPIESLSNDPEQEHFAEGMTDELITTLGQISALRVISRTSVVRYQGTKKPLPQIARELNVDAIVEGTVLRSGDRVRITAQLIDARADRHLWAQTYERDLGDVLALQSDVARAIVREIRVKVTPQENLRLASARPVNPEAHRLYVMGRYYWNKRNAEGLTKANEQFLRAIEIDPTYAPAYAGLADSYLQLANGGVRSPNETMPKAKAAARKALEIDESLAQAHTSLAEIYKDYDWDWEASEKEFKRAIELNPNYATAHQWYAEYLTLTRRHAEAIAEAQRAEQLDPLSPIIRVGAATFGGYLYARQYNEAIRLLQNTVSMFPNFRDAYWQLANACAAKGMEQEAFVSYRKALSLSGASPAELAALGRAYAKGGIRGYYLWRIEELRKKSKRRYISPVNLAFCYAAIGDKDHAFSFLEKAYKDRDWLLNTLQVNPRFDPLRSDPRFQDYLRRMNFPK